MAGSRDIEGRKGGQQRPGGTSAARKTSESVTPPSGPPLPPSLIVGIGASAGGLDAFKTFLANMPPDSGMGFVLVQHLAPLHKSMLVELLAVHTAMPVLAAVDGMFVAANSVYIIPPDATLIIKQGRLGVTTPAPERQLRRPIDTFFASLAEDQEESAVCIVLSGTGSDGSLGLRKIKELGGLCLAQAAFDETAMSGMPQSAAATGLVDYVLPVAAIPAKLLEYQRHLTEVAGQKDDEGSRQDLPKHLTAITTLLRKGIGHDFGQYKEKTLVRRIQRRMQVLQIDDVRQYIERLRQEPGQVEALFRDLLIGVTEFFRNEDAFKALRETIIPELLAKAAEAKNPVRIWVPGCATGEEAYSIAILLREAMEEKELTASAQIFGTDIDESAVAIARTARYRLPMTGLSPERLRRWFVRNGEDYCPTRDVREMCVFSVHSVIKDPPFSKLDLIACRNLMIYLNADLQDRIVRTFHYALRPGSYLFLGTSEGVTRNTALFEACDKKQRIFRRRGGNATAPGLALGAAATRPPAPSAGRIEAPENDRIGRIGRRVMEKYSPAYVVIDKHHEILRFSGGEVGQYLKPSQGVASLNLFNVLRKPLRPAVLAAVQAARHGQQPVIHQGLATKINGHDRLITLIVEPIPESGGEAGHCIVAFQEAGPYSAETADSVPPQAAATHIQTLEQELRTTKAQLTGLVDDLETTNEEMKSANEEFQSVNEELQASNEELETSKEEMQSVNEELQTINGEMNSKNELLVRLNNDMKNLLESTQIATIFLDSDLRIKSFTPTCTELFNLRDSDRGRPLTDFASKLKYANLQDDVQKVLRTLAVIENELQLFDESDTFMLRMRPYRTVDNVIDGVVMTFIEITERKAIEERLAARERRFRALVEASSQIVWTANANGEVEEDSPSWRAFSGQTFEQRKGLGWLDAIHPDDREPTSALWKSAVAEKIPMSTEYRLRHMSGDWRWTAVNAVPLIDAGMVSGWVGMNLDITGRKQAEAQRDLLLHELNHRVKNTLATVVSIAQQSLKSSPSLEEFRKAFLKRIVALSKTQDLLTRTGGRSTTLHDLVQAELAPFQNDKNSRWITTGESVLLKQEIALALGLALHELATNAAKYGALSVPTGRIELAWRVQDFIDGRHLHFAWTETGGPPVATPSRKGFGSRLIEEGLAHELDGKVSLDFDPSGVRCTIVVPFPTAKEN